MFNDIYIHKTHINLESFGNLETCLFLLGIFKYILIIIERFKLNIEYKRVQLQSSLSYIFNIIFINNIILRYGDKKKT